MFIGEYTNTLDRKNRVIVPAKFREILEHAREPVGFYLVRGLEGCLYMYTSRQWASLKESLARMHEGTFGNKRLRKFERLFFSSAVYCPLDRQGRIHIPEKLLRLAGIKREVAFIGVSGRIEVWDAEGWTRFESESDGEFEAVAEDLF
jgi:MraZ protein